MSDTPQAPAAPPPNAPAPAADPSRQGVRWVVLLIVLSLIWYLLADRFTPYTQQARVQAFVVPGGLGSIGTGDQGVCAQQPGGSGRTVLFEVDPDAPDRCRRARADLESTRRQIGAGTAGIDSARASLRAAQADEVKAPRIASASKACTAKTRARFRCGASKWRVPPLNRPISQVAAARAEVQRAREQEGGNEDENAKLRSAATASRRPNSI